MPAVSNKPIVEKLFIKPGKSFLFVNAPAHYEKLIGKIPAGAERATDSSKNIDVIKVFVRNEKELTQQLPKLKKQLKSDGALWVAYYKGTAKTKTDINRDSINDYANTIGLEGVAIMSVDDDWSALRLKIV
jgi:hypothetical protein